MFGMFGVPKADKILQKKINEATIMLRQNEELELYHRKMKEYQQEHLAVLLRYNNDGAKQSEPRNISLVAD